MLMIMCKIRKNSPKFDGGKFGGTFWAPFIDIMFIKAMNFPNIYSHQARAFQPSYISHKFRWIWANSSIALALYVDLQPAKAVFRRFKICKMSVDPSGTKLGSVRTLSPKPLATPTTRSNISSTASKLLWKQKKRYDTVAISPVFCSFLRLQRFWVSSLKTAIAVRIGVREVPDMDRRLKLKVKKITLWWIEKMRNTKALWRTNSKRALHLKLMMQLKHCHVNVANWNWHQNWSLRVNKLSHKNNRTFSIYQATKRRKVQMPTQFGNRS